MASPFTAATPPSGPQSGGTPLETPSLTPIPSITYVRRGTKLGTNVPDAATGERPYYHEAYHHYCQTTLQMKEAVQVSNGLVQASNIYYLLTRQHAQFKKYKRGERESGKFLWNDVMQTSLHTSIAKLQKAEVWEERTTQSRNLAEAILPVCEEAVYAANRLFRNRSPVPKSLIPLDNTTSFIAVDFGCLIHVWYSSVEAKTFVYSQQTVAEKLAELRIDCIFAPFSMMFLIHSMTVTVTPLVPLPSTKRMLVESIQLSRILVELDCYARTRTPLQLYSGSDSRYYVLDCMPALHVDGENQGETSCLSRMILFDLFPNLDEYPHTLLRSGRNMLDTVVNDMLEAATMFSEKVGGISNVKIHDIVTNRLIPKACHAHGYKVSYLYDAYTHKQLQGFGLASVLKETLVAEMVCRTFKEILRAEIATVRLIPTPEADIDSVKSFIVELANRCVFNLLTKEELWAPHVLPVLRTKFKTPDNFFIPQIAVTKRTVLAYLNSRLGLIFEGGRFHKLVTLPVMTTLVRPCQVTKLVLQSHQSEAHQQLLSNWKKIADISSPQRQLCAMRHQVSLFAIARSERLDWYVNIIQMKMDEFNFDDVAKAVMNPLLVECLAELSDSSRCAAMFDESLTRDIPLYFRHPQDFNVGAERYRAAAQVFENIDPHAETEIGTLRVDGVRYLRKDTLAIDSATSFRNVELYSDAMNYLYTLENTHEEIAKMLAWLKGAKTSRPRMIYLGEEFTKFSSGSLHVPYDAVIEARGVFRDLSTENFEIHQELYADTETPWQIALLLFCAHWGNCHKEVLTKEQWADYEKFRDASIKIQSALISEQKGMLKGEWFVALTGPVATILMEYAEWGKALALLALGHHVLSDGKVDGNVKAVDPSLPCMKKPAFTMSCAVKGCKRVQNRQRRRIAIRDSEKQRQIESRAKREKNSLTRANLVNNPLPMDLIFAASKYCAENATNPRSHTLPRLDQWYSVTGDTSAYRNKLHGLRLLLNVAPVKRTPKLCAIIIYSGHFPPFRWAEVPHTPGVRHIVITPDTSVSGAFWHKHWVALAKFTDSSVPLYAKIAASYLYSQFRFTYLFFTVVGFGWGSPIAECLAALIPIEESQTLITFGGPPTFTNVKAMSPMGHAHIVHEEDLAARVFGTLRMPGLKAKLASKLDGLGVIIPYPPTKRQMTATCVLNHYGSRIHQIKRVVADPANPNVTVTTISDLSVESFKEESIELRSQYWTMTPLFYHACMKLLCPSLVAVEPVVPLAALIPVKDAKGKLVLQPQAQYKPPVIHWRPEKSKLMTTDMDKEGNASEAVRDLITVPEGVERNVATVDLMMLAYPRITTKIFNGLLQLTEDYGFSMEGSPNAQFVQSIMKCRSTEILTNLLNSFVGASWQGEALANQLIELSGITNGIQRQSLNEFLVAAFVEKHSFLFTMCPETTKGAESISILDRLSRNMTDDQKKRFNTPEGYHVGWSLAISATVASIDRQVILKALLGASCQTNQISDVHPRNQRSMFTPAIRFALIPQRGVVSTTRGLVSQQSGISLDSNEKRKVKVTEPGSPTLKGADNKSKIKNDKDDGPKVEPSILIQMNLQSFLFDGSNAAQTILRSCAQCVWIVADDYTFEHLQQTVDFSDPSPDLSVVVVYCPLLMNDVRTLNFELRTKIRVFCDSKQLVYLYVDPSNPETVTPLVSALMNDMSPGIRVPLNQMALVRCVSVGAMWDPDPDEIARQQRKVQATLIKPEPEPELTERQKRVLEKKPNDLEKKQSMHKRTGSKDGSAEPAADDDDARFVDYKLPQTLMTTSAPVKNVSTPPSSSLQPITTGQVRKDLPAVKTPPPGMTKSKSNLAPALSGKEQSNAKPTKGK